MGDITHTDTGAEVYFTDPCRRGHNGMRYVSNGECVECRALLYQQKLKETMKHLEDAIFEMHKLEDEFLNDD